MIAAASLFRRRWMTLENTLFAWHFWLTLVLVWWTFVLAEPAPTFAISKAYTRFEAICPDEQFWACGFGFASLMGLCSTWAAWPSRAARGVPWVTVLRWWGVFAMAVVHGLIAMLMFDGAPAGTGSGTYVLIMCSAYLLMRAEYERS